MGKSEIAFMLAAPFLQGQPPVPASPAAAPQTAPAAPQTPAQRLADLKRAYDEAQRAFEEKYSAAKSEPERAKVYETDYPSPESYAPRFVALAKELGSDPVALEAWTWIVQRVQSREVVDPCFEAIAAGHVASPRLVDVVQAISPYQPSVAAERFLRTVAEKSPHWEVKGHATFKLASILNGLAEAAEALTNDAKDAKEPGSRERLAAYYGKESVAELAARDPAEMRKEAEDLYEDVLADFKAVRSAQGTLGQQAEAELFELRNLALGRVAPEIVGQDVDGVTFKLSDYRGKVVVLDFWGFW
jgi:hypothetical protein